METPNWRQIAAGLLAVVVLGLIGFFGQARVKNSPSTDSSPKKKIATPNTSVVSPKAEEGKSSNPVAEPKQIAVDIDGAVFRPGVYWLLEGSRLQDVVVMAGGLKPEADRTRVNLALPLRDGAKILVPILSSNETSSFSGVAPVQSMNGQATESSPEPNTIESTSEVEREPKIININTATRADFEQLPSVGPALAGRIVDYREGIGGFKSIDEIKNVRGVGEKIFQKIRNYLAI